MSVSKTPAAPPGFVDALQRLTSQVQRLEEQVQAVKQSVMVGCAPPYPPYFGQVGGDPSRRVYVYPNPPSTQAGMPAAVFTIPGGKWMRVCAPREMITTSDGEGTLKSSGWFHLQHVDAKTGELRDLWVPDVGEDGQATFGKFSAVAEPAAVAAPPRPSPV